MKFCRLLCHIHQNAVYNFFWILVSALPSILKKNYLSLSHERWLNNGCIVKKKNYNNCIIELILCNSWVCKNTGFASIHYHIIRYVHFRDLTESESWKLFQLKAPTESESGIQLGKGLKVAMFWLRVFGDLGMTKDNMGSIGLTHRYFWQIIN